MASKGYNFKLSALQIQALVSLRDKLGDMADDPILESIFTSANQFWIETVVPNEMGQAPKRGKKQAKAEVPTQAEIKQFELKEDEPLAEGTAQPVETMSATNNKKK